MKKLLFLAILLAGCGEEIPSAKVGAATNCVQLNTPVGCATVYRITDPDTGAVLYIAAGQSSVTILPKSEVRPEKPAAR